MNSNRSPGWRSIVAAGVVGHTLWTSVAPTMVYPLYAERWGLSQTVVAGIFAIYPMVVVGTLVTLSSLSDVLGGRRVMLYGVAASAAGVLLFAIATSVPMLFLGRTFMGLGVGLSAGPSAAALVEYAGDGGGRRGSAATLAAQAAGFAAALLVGGGLAQYAPFPTRLSFVLLLALLAGLFLGVRSLPRQEADPAAGLRPRMPQVPRASRRTFWIASFVLMVAYADGAIISSFGAQIAHDLVLSDNLLVNGAALALFPFAMGLSGLFASRTTASSAMLWGSGAVLLAMAAMATAVVRHDLASLTLATLSAGVGYTLLAYGGFTMLSDLAPARSRGSVTSVALVPSYLFSGLLAVALGRLATVAGMTTSVLTGVALISTLAGCVVPMAIRRIRSGPSSLAGLGHPCAAEATHSAARW